MSAKKKATKVQKIVKTAKALQGFAPLTQSEKKARKKR